MSGSGSDADPPDVDPSPLPSDLDPEQLDPEQLDLDQLDPDQLDAGDPDLPFGDEKDERPAPAPVAVRVRRSLTGWLTSVRPRPRNLRSDAVAGVSNAIASVPDGMAMALLVGVNPAYGLYASFAGKIGGGLFSSTALMVVTTTTAASLAAGSALEDLPESGRDGAVITLTMFVGVAAGRGGTAAAGSVHPIRVPVGDGRIPDRHRGQHHLRPAAGSARGAPTERGVAVAEGLVRRHANPAGITMPSALVGVGALAVMFLLGRTRLALFATLIAVVVPTVGGGAGGPGRGRDGRRRRGDPGGLPAAGAAAPVGSVDVDLITGAFAIAAIALVQGAGVAESAPNPDGTPSSIEPRLHRPGRRQPVVRRSSTALRSAGRSSTTALNIAAGARSRWASIFGGVWMLIILVALARVVGMVPMPTLSAVLIFAAVMIAAAGGHRGRLEDQHTGKIAMVGHLPVHPGAAGRGRGRGRA